MEHNRLEQKVQRWADELAVAGDKEGRDSIKRLLHQLNFLERRLYFSYEPSRPPNAGYMQRLGAWIDNVADEREQRLALALAAELFYVGHNEIAALNRAAFTGPIRKWLVQLHNLSFRDPEISLKLSERVNRTWFCPITDSMNINQFVHLNQIKNEINDRPDWQSLVKLSTPAQLDLLMKKENVEQLVLLEDFIATGSQAMDAIKLAASVRPTAPIPVLVVPLVSCPKAKENFELARFPPHVTIAPVLQLRENNFVSADSAKNSAIFNEIKALAEATYARVSGGIPLGIKPYGPLGFLETGGLVVLDTNTPDNTLPIIHWTSATWSPLFPRHSRI